MSASSGMQPGPVPRSAHGGKPYEPPASTNARNAKPPKRAPAVSMRSPGVENRHGGRWESLIEERNGASYERATILLQDLQALAERNGATAALGKRIADVRIRHSRKGTFISRLNKAGLP